MERTAYLFTAIAFCIFTISLSYHTFVYQMNQENANSNGNLQVFGAFFMAVCAAVGMEFYARYAHKYLWHSSLWSLHKSHHAPGKGPFEFNDIFFVLNALPAICLMIYGFLLKGLVPSLCFGTGLGMTIFGMGYMFVHDGLVHRRFPVGPIANIKYFKRVVIAHQMHHTNVLNGVPYGLFLGPREVELDKQRRLKMKT